MFNFLCFFVLLNAVKTDTKLTLHHIRKILLLNIKIKFKIWRVTFLKSFFFTIKKIGDVLPIFAQDTIYYVRTEMRRSLVYADFVLRYSETCL